MRRGDGEGDYKEVNEEKAGKLQGNGQWTGFFVEKIQLQFL